MRRGALTTVALSGSFGKPRPALVVQADLFKPTATVTVLLVSGTLVDAPLIRIQVEPSPENGQGDMTPDEKRAVSALAAVLKATRKEKR